MSAVVSPLRSSKAPAPAAVWMSPSQVCERIPGMTEEILAQRRKKGLKPDYRKPSQKTVIYEQSEIDAWVESTRVAGRAG